MRINRRVDSVGATRWVKRAETLARSARLEYQTTREIQDGYLLEGKRAGDIRTARVVDIPGRFVPFGHTGTAIGIPGASESWWPAWAGAPTRRITLEQRKPEDDEPPLEFAYEHPDARQLTAHFIGAPPTTGLRSLGIAAPTSSADWVTQVRTVYPNTDPVPAVNVDDLLINYSGVTSLWVMVDAWGSGVRNKFTMLINEQEVISTFGVPIIRKTWSNYGFQSADTRAWATVISPVKVVVALWLSDDELVGKAGSLGLMVYEVVDGEWVLAGSHRVKQYDPEQDDLEQDDPKQDYLTHPLFALHYRVNASGAPLDPAQRSSLRPRDPAMMNDGRSAVFLTTLRHELDATTGSIYSPVVISAVLRVEIDLETYEVTVEVEHVNTDAELSTGETLTTTEGVLVAGAISYPWDAGEWPVYCWLHYDGSTMHEVLGFARGIRTDIIKEGVAGMAPWHVHAYQEDPIRMAFRTVTMEDGEPIEVVTDMLISEAGFNMLTSAGSPVTVLLHDPFDDPITIAMIFGMTDGGNSEIPMSYCGLGVYEMSLYRAGTTTRVIARIDTVEGVVSEAALPSGADRPVSTCYAQSRILVDEDEDEDETEIPHRSVVTYRSGGATTIELRTGDDVVARASEVAQDIRLGIYYMGNPFASARYGKMEALV